MLARGRRLLWPMPAARAPTPAPQLEAPPSGQDTRRWNTTRRALLLARSLAKGLLLSAPPLYLCFAMLLQCQLSPHRCHPHRLPSTRLAPGLLQLRAHHHLRCGGLLAWRVR